MLDFNISSDILMSTKPHISEYSHFNSDLRYKAIYRVTCRAYNPGIMSADNTKGLKLCLNSRQVWRYLYLFSLSAFATDFSGVMQR